MIYNVVGQEFIYEGVTYRVGAEVVGTAESDYRGLNGFILEIRTGRLVSRAISKNSKNASLHCTVPRRNWKTLLWTMLSWRPMRSSCCRVLERP